MRGYGFGWVVMPRCLGHDEDGRLLLPARVVLNILGEPNSLDVCDFCTGVTVGGCVPCDDGHVSCMRYGAVQKR